MNSPSDQPPPLLAELLDPLAELALREGVSLRILIDQIKQSLVKAAAVITDDQGKVRARNDSQVSLMTGVHRKDVRSLRAHPARRPGRRRNLAAEVFARWLSDTRFITARGKPRVLHRRHYDSSPSFDELVESISRDVHPRSVLDELLRLGLVTAGHQPVAAGGTVKVIAKAFTPYDDRRGQLGFLIANAADHLRAGCRNLDSGGTSLLEQAIYSDELSAHSAAQFNQLTLKAWQDTFDRLMPRLRALYAQDQMEKRPLTHRVRLGMYGFVGERSDS